MLLLLFLLLVKFLLVLLLLLDILVWVTFPRYQLTILVVIGLLPVLALHRSQSFSLSCRTTLSTHWSTLSWLNSLSLTAGRVCRCGPIWNGALRKGVSCGVSPSWLVAARVSIVDGVLGDDWVEEVRIAAVGIRVVPNALLQPLLLSELFVPLASRVSWLSLLKTSQKLSIVFRDFCNFTNSRSSVQGIVRVEAFRVGFWHFKGTIILSLLLLRFCINLQHFAEQDPVLVLDFTHSLCRIQKKVSKEIQIFCDPFLEPFLSEISFVTYPDFAFLFLNFAWYELVSWAVKPWWWVWFVWGAQCVRCAPLLFLVRRWFDLMRLGPTL